MRPLVWLRADLRVADNPALHHACAAASRGCIAVFVITPEQWREHHWSDVKVDLILRTLGELSGELDKINVPLLVRTAGRFRDVPQLLLDLARKHECDELHFCHEYEVNESRRDETVTGIFEDAGLRVRGWHDQTIVPPGDLRTGSDGYYTVFTPFFRAWKKRLGRDGIPEALSRPKRQRDRACAPDEIPAAVDGFEFAGASPDLWPAGEREARRRLARFIDKRIRGYSTARDHPALDATSRLSPYLTVGAISIGQCLRAAVEANGNSLGRKTGAATWISELAWREFYRHFLVGFPRVCMDRPFKLKTEKIQWRDDDKGFDAWREGRTGVPIVDAAMRQLDETGWMHNRLRMVTAMFLTKDLFIDWRRGERYFMQRLIDGDLASNNGGWQWSASTGADAAPWFRVFNPYRQSERFDADGEFIRTWVSELSKVEGDDVHDPPPLLREQLGYPIAIVDHAEAARRAIAAFKTLT